MAKKKVEVSLDRNPMRDTPLTGDIEIDYGGETVYATSETNQIFLLTQNKVCLKDIVVDYTKPEPEPNYVPVTIINSATAQFTTEYDACVIINIIDNNIVLNQEGNWISANGIIPSYSSSNYEYQLEIITDSDILNITVNGEAVEYITDDNRYTINYSNSVYPPAITISIANKANK